MSYILDALRKAEQERQTKRAPDLHSVQPGGAAPQTPVSKWLWIAVGLVAIVAVNATFWLWQSRAPAKGEPVAGSQYRGEPPSQQSRTAAQQREAKAHVDAELAAAQPANATPSGQRQVQELWQVASHIKAAVQDLKFSFHVYSSKPERRTIIINGHRMREGDKITADLTLQEITKDGVILAHPDTLVNVSVLQQW